MPAPLATPACCTEFPTLDLAELDQAALKPAVYLSTFEREEFTRVLGAALPYVAHAARRVTDTRSEHEFIDVRDGAAVRLVLTLDPRTHEVRAHIAETGPAGLWDRIVNTAAQWDQDGRPQPPCWSSR